jgi:hypothetical protein
VKRSAEVRWFYHHALPLEVKKWFCGLRPCREEAARTDRYFVLHGGNEVGVRVRDGRKLEIKARTKMPQPFSPATGASVGRHDEWAEWSCEDRDVAGPLAALGDSSPE